jgi:hypothetical protein
VPLGAYSKALESVEPVSKCSKGRHRRYAARGGLMRVIRRGQYRRHALRGYSGRGLYPSSLEQVGAERSRVRTPCEIAKDPLSSFCSEIKRGSSR